MGFRNYGAGPGKVTSGTVGLTASGILLARSIQRRFLAVHNPSATLTLSFTVDGTTPTINGAGTFTCGPLGSFIFDAFVPTGDLIFIGSGASTPYSILADQ